MPKISIYRRKRFSRYKNLFRMFVQSPMASFRMLGAIVTFMGGSNVGRGMRKILIRCSDLANIFSILAPNKPVLEFGSGVSSIFFLRHPKVSQLITYEDQPQYLARKVPNFGKEYKVITDKFRNEKIGTLSVTRASDFEGFLSSPSIIYIDGPSTPIDIHTNRAIPNSEILSVQDLSNHVILVDGRIDTVKLIYNSLKHSHLFYPSLAYLKENSIEDSTDGILYSMGKGLTTNVRTSAFIPLLYGG